MSEATRRRFLGNLLAGGCAACLSGGAGVRLALGQDVSKGKSLVPVREKELGLAPARWWKKLPQEWVECSLCPRGCKVSEGERGTCGVRENRGGEYLTLVHSRACSLHLDPIEKKPFFHLLPGGTALSLAAPGCNMECKSCQNWEIAQVRPEQVQTGLLTPARIVELARENRAPTIACTYTEPVVWSEYVYDIAEASKKAGIRTLIVSNGYIQAQPMNDLLDVLGGVKIDLKGFSESFYQEHCRGELKPVLDTLKLLKKRNAWFEIVTLVIPGLNDTSQELTALARFVKEDLGPDVPLHFTRFHPAYRLMNIPPTPVATLERARQTALDLGLHFVYVGNVPGHAGNHTYCPSCKTPLIRRTGMAVLENRLKNGKCPDCQRPIPGVWM